MGAALYVDLEKEIPGLDTFVNGKGLSVSEKQLDKLAKMLGITPLMNFFSADPEEVLDFMDDEAEAAGDIPPMEAEQWYEPEDGLRTVRALRDHLRANPKELRFTEAVISDLDEFEKVLGGALSEKVRWHLAVDF